ncbi:hypothetical protein C8J56DRAFT_1091774 [Mycena floridula]|nr:hypothetical protein C8J56DRAFT_1091774 [Mycena floridula]
MTAKTNINALFRQSKRLEPLIIVSLDLFQICPFAHRASLRLHSTLRIVQVELAEVIGQFTRYEIDINNKPEWNAPKIKPANQPSPESEKIAESLVLVEFVADLYPDSHLSPKVPVEQAKARLFIDTVSNKFVPAFYGTIIHHQSFDKGLDAIEALQHLLRKDKKFVVSDEFYHR